MSTITTKDGIADLLQGLGQRTADRVQPWLAAVGRRLGCADDVLPVARISRDRARPARSRPLDTDRWTATTWIPMPPTWRALAGHLDLRNAIHVGHSTGGGEVARYVARHGAGRVAKAVLIGAVPPIMVKSENNPGGLPIEVFDGFRAAAGSPTARSSFSISLPVRSMGTTAGREGLPRRDRQLVAPGHDGRRQGALRLHQGVLGDRLHRRPEGDRRAGAGHAWRRRPDRAVSPTRRRSRQSSQERDAEDLSRAAARHVHDARRT